MKTINDAKLKPGSWMEASRVWTFLESNHIRIPVWFLSGKEFVDTLKLRRVVGIEDFRKIECEVPTHLIF